MSEKDYNFVSLVSPLLVAILEVTISLCVFYSFLSLRLRLPVFPVFENNVIMLKMIN